MRLRRIARPLARKGLSVIEAFLPSDLPHSVGISTASHLDRDSSKRNPDERRQTRHPGWSSRTWLHSRGPHHIAMHSTDGHHTDTLADGHLARTMLLRAQPRGR